MYITLSNIDDVFRAKKASVESMELKGYELIEMFFVDSSGFGAYDEPALTVPRFKAELTKLLEQHGKLMAKIIDAGMFQVYVGVFKKTGKSKVTQVTPTVSERYEDNKLIIRLHDTDILTIEGNNYTLNSGGWHTATTKKYLNEYLPDELRVYQKDFEWFIDIGQEAVPFTDGMTVTYK